MDDYSSLSIDGYSDEPEYGDVEADEEGYIDILDDPSENERLEKLETEDLIQRLLGAISDLFCLRA